MDALKLKYDKEILPKLIKQFNYSNRMQAPKVEKVVINMGLGKEVQQEAKVVDQAAKQLALLAGQKPIITKARKSIATYKLRKGMKIGVAVTLRRQRMYSFLNRLINVALPRVKDFKGLLKRGMDGRGNYTFGLKEQLIFPEIEYDSIDRIRGMNITIVTSAKSDEEGLALLTELGVPFRN